jgi:hypothetical protein
MNIPVKPIKFPSIDIDFGTTVAKALWLQAAQLVTYIEQSYPLGMLMFVELSQLGLPAGPDQRFWKYADGTPVNNANSIFNGMSFPDLRGKFIRHPVSGEIAFSTGGVSSFDLSHGHTGFTDYANDSGRQNNDDDSQQRAQPGIHRHFITTDTLTYNTIPTSHEVQVYIRIA